jgi:hypothetical protein
MGNIGSAFGGALLVGLLGALIYGSIVMLIYLIISKIKKRKLNKRVILKIYTITFTICGIFMLFALFFVPKTSSKQLSSAQVNPIINLLPLIIIVGIIFIIKLSGKKKYDVEGGLKITKEEHSHLIQKLGGRGEKLVRDNISEDKIFVKLKGSFGEALVIADKNLYVLKWGFMAGNFLGGRCMSFGHRNIVGLEIKKGWTTGTFEVLTPATQNAQKSYWGMGSNNAIRSDNVITFQSNKFNLFQEAVKIGRELINKSHSQGSQNSQNEPNYSELEKLAELKEKGIITQEEFNLKKKQILGL